MSPDTREYDLACLIVNFGLGSKVLRIAKANGVAGGTVFIGRGTLKSRWLEFFEINESRKEIVLMVSRKDVIRKVLPILNHELGLCKPNHGIAFRTELSSIAGSRPVNRPEYKPEPEKVGEKMYQAIYVIVSKGKAEDVVDAAAAAGARGGTIINARGSGIQYSIDLTA